MKILFAILIILSAGNCSAESYFEIGAFYLENQFYKSSIVEGQKEFEYSGNMAAHAAFGYEFNLDSIEIDIQIKHQSDPNEHGDNDLIDNNAIGVVVRKYLK